MIAKCEALALLREMLGSSLSPPAPTGETQIRRGEMSPSSGTERVNEVVPFLRERRLAASQILRTPLLRTDDNGEVHDNRRRTRARLPSRQSGVTDLDRHSEISTLKSETPESGMCLPLPAGPRRPSDTGGADVPARRDGTPDQVASSLPQGPGPKPQDPSPCLSVSVVDSDSSAEARLSQIESHRADLREATRGLCGVDRKRIIKRALAELRAKARAPT